MPQPKVRIGGSGFTVFSYGGKTLAYLQTIQDTAPTPVAQAVPVQSITDSVPSEIVTARAVGAGTLRLTFYETWNASVWQALPGLSKATNLLSVLQTQVKLGAVSCRKIIKKPAGGTRAKVYHNCMIVDVDDGEQINIATMVLPKGLTIMYTHATIV